MREASSDRWPVNVPPEFNSQHVPLNRAIIEIPLVLNCVRSLCALTGIFVLLLSSFVRLHVK